MVLTLLEEILGGNDQARLVYADSLLARGDPRGELITVEHELVDATGAARRTLLRRRRKLRDAHTLDWWPELPAHRLVTRRGFVERVTARSEELALATAFPAREPVTELDLIGDDLAVPTAWIRRLRHLTVAAGGEAEELQALLRACSSLTSVAIHHVYLAAHTLPLGSLLPNCTHVNLAGEDLYAKAATVLEWRHIAKLEHLDLTGCSVDATTVGAILSRGLPKLRVLRLSNNRLGDGARHVFAKHLPSLPALRRLEICNNGIDENDRNAIKSLRPDVDVIVDDVRPESFSVEINGCAVTFVARRNELWSIEIDGEPADIHVESTDTVTNERLKNRGRSLPLETLATAYVRGQPLVAYDSGARMTIGHGSTLVLDEDWVSTTETAEIRINGLVAYIATERFARDRY